MSDTITVVGTVGTEPEIRRTDSGLTIASFRVASTQRRFDKRTEKWIDGETNWYSVSAFRRLAENVGASIHKGERVVLTGRLKLREWQNDRGKGSAVEIDLEAVGHDLLWGTSTFAKNSDATRAAAAPTEPVHSGAAGDGWTVPGTDIDEAVGGTERSELVGVGETPF